MSDEPKSTQSEEKFLEKDIGKFLSFEELQAIPAWFAVVAGLIYATGFLIEFTFLNSMGIRESVTEVFKAKYIYVGLLCWVFPISAGLMVFGVSRREHRIKNEKKISPSAKTGLHWTTTVLLILLVFNFYLFICFSPPGFFYSRQGWFFLWFFFVIWTLRAIRPFEEMIEIILPKLEKKYPTPYPPVNFKKKIKFIFFLIYLLYGTKSYERRINSKIEKAPALLPLLKNFDHEGKKNWGLVARSFLTIVIFIATIRIFWPLIWGTHFWPPQSLLGQMFFSGGYWYFIFVIQAGRIIRAIDVRKGDYAKNHLKMEYMAVMLPYLAIFLCLSVLAFAHNVYRYIPVEKGGGDYTREKASVLTFNAQFSHSLPAEIFDGSPTNLQSQQVLILDETANTLFVTMPTNLDEIARWRYSNNKPEIIYAIKHEAVIGIKSEPWPWSSTNSTDY